MMQLVWLALFGVLVYWALLVVLFYWALRAELLPKEE